MSLLPSRPERQPALRLNPRDLAFVALGQVAGGVGGAIAWWIGVPLPWLIGALAMVATLSMLGLPLGTRRSLRDAGVLVLLTGIGLTFTPQAAETSLRLLPMILLAALATLLIGCIASLLLARLSNIDRTTAFFCSVPGGPAEMSVLGARQGAKMPPIAICQLMRIVTLVVVIPPTMVLLDLHGEHVWTFSADPFHLPGFLVTMGLSLALALMLRWMNVTAAFIVGPLAVGIALGASDAHLSSVPAELMMACQVLMGAYLGAQFRRDVLRSMKRFLPAALMNVLLVTLACATLGFLLHLVDDESIATMVLATAPGSVTEMSITAQALGFNVPVVTAFHVIRILILVMLISPAFTAMRAIGLIPACHAGRPASPIPPQPAPQSALQPLPQSLSKDAEK